MNFLTNSYLELLDLTLAELAGVDGGHGSAGAHVQVVVPGDDERLLLLDGDAREGGHGDGRWRHRVRRQHAHARPRHVARLVGQRRQLHVVAVGVEREADRGRSRRVGAGAGLRRRHRVVERLGHRLGQRRVLRRVAEAELERRAAAAHLLGMFDGGAGAGALAAALGGAWRGSGRAARGRRVHHVVFVLLLVGQVFLVLEVLQGQRLNRADGDWRWRRVDHDLSLQVICKYKTTTLVYNLKKN